MKYFILITLTFVTFYSWGENRCSIKGTKLIYINGIKTEELDAKKAMERINKEILYQNFDSYHINAAPTFQHNFSETMAIDFLEAIVQIMPNNFLEFLQISDPYAAFRKFCRVEVSINKDFI